MIFCKPEPDKNTRLAWFKDRSYEQLFVRNRVASAALRKFGFVKRSRPSPIFVLIGAMLLILSGSLFYHHWIPAKNACYVVHGNVMLRSNSGTPFENSTPVTAETICPAETRKALLSSDWPQLFSNFSILITLLFGWHQWATSRSHASLAEAFTRKLSSNQTIMGEPKKLGHFIAAAQKGSIEPQVSAIVPKVSAAAEPNREPVRAGAASGVDNAPAVDSANGNVIPDIFIYMEMDNLEYVFEKYRDSEISSRSALRQCFIFASRCGDKEFREKAPKFAAIGFYRPDFKKTVDFIASFASEHLERMMKQSQDSIA
jgi:hypothetical protein